MRLKITIRPNTYSSPETYVTPPLSADIADSVANILAKTAKTDARQLHGYTKDATLVASGCMRMAVEQVEDDVVISHAEAAKIEAEIAALEAQKARDKAEKAKAEELAAV